MSSLNNNIPYYSWFQHKINPNPVTHRVLMAQMSTLSSAKLFANPCELNGKIEWWISMELVPSCGGAVCSCRGDWTCESAAAGAGGGGGEGLFPLRCVTALAARTADVWPASVLQCLSAVTPPPVITLTGASALRLAPAPQSLSMCG